MSAGRLKPRAVTVMGFQSGRSGEVERVHCWEKEPGDKQAWGSRGSEKTEATEKYMWDKMGIVGQGAADLNYF